MEETAVLGGGCFWCVEAVMQELEGVTSVISGYAGGRLPNPTYRQVCGGDSGHIEVVRVTFDPSVIGYRELLQVFFATHDPTTWDRQGNDVGPQYRSVIFVQSEEQRRIAEQLIAELEAERVFERPIVTQVLSAEPFWPAEDYHQNYFRNNPQQGYCSFVISPKVAKLRSRFAHRLKAAARQE